LRLGVYHNAEGSARSGMEIETRNPREESFVSLCDAPKQ
jgi:hypothetical protein